MLHLVVYVQQEWELNFCGIQWAKEHKCKSWWLVMSQANNKKLMVCADNSHIRIQIVVSKKPQLIQQQEWDWYWNYGASTYLQKVYASKPRKELLQLWRSIGVPISGVKLSIITKSDSSRVKRLVTKVVTRSKIYLQEWMILKILKMEYTYITHRSRNR